MTEEAALEGLKLFAETSGRYPKKIDLMSLMREFTALNAGEDRAGTLLKLKEEARQMAKRQDLTKAEITKTREARIKAMVAKTMEAMRPVQSLAMFYMTLVGDDKEPAYYGETVGPDDADAVLMRWKISDGLYRVVFGDLLTSDVTAEDLAKLEEFSIDSGYKRPSITEEAAPGRYKSAATDHCDRGEVHYLDGEYDLAIADYSKAIEIDPTIADAYIGRARVYCDKGEYDKAWKDVHEAQALGRQVYSKLLERLRKASGRDE
jgi:tetratricopeptide (TPR) repeat protein